MSTYFDEGYFEPNYLDSGYFGIATVAETNPDLPSAIIAKLRATPAVVSAFGEDTSSTATTKFHADVAHKAELPWCVYEEIGEDPRPVSVDSEGLTNYFCQGRIAFTVVASGKKEARTLADLIASTLNDAPLTFDDGELLEFRTEANRARPDPDIGPGSPAMFQRVVVFLYMCQRVF
jgi:hypothetical protein